MKRVLGLLLVLGIFLSGCTGWEADPAQHATLKDLYTTTGGLYAHWKISMFLAAQARAAGATETHIEMSMPFNKKRADFVAVFDRRDGLHAKANEIKPYPKGSFDTGVIEANAQLNGYLTMLRRSSRYRTVSQNRTFAAEPTPRVVPATYTPELAARCLELRVRTYENIAPGIVFYWFAHKNDTSACRNRTRDERSADIGGWMYEVSSMTIPRNYRVDYARLRVAQVYDEEGAADLQEAIYYPYEADSGPDVGGTPAWPSNRHNQVRDYLFSQQVPSWFRVSPTPWPVPIAGQNNGQHWECNTEAC